MLACIFSVYGDIQYRQIVKILRLVALLKQLLIMFVFCSSPTHRYSIPIPNNDVPIYMFFCCQRTEHQEMVTGMWPMKIHGNSR